MFFLLKFTCAEPVEKIKSHVRLGTSSQINNIIYSKGVQAYLLTI